VKKGILRRIVQQ